MPEKVLSRESGPTLRRITEYGGGSQKYWEYANAAKQASKTMVFIIRYMTIILGPNRLAS
jgi:hypothetical protein